MQPMGPVMSERAEMPAPTTQQVPVVPKRADRRAAKRYHCSPALLCRVQVPGRGVALLCCVNTLSMSGIGLASADAVDVDTELVLSIRPPRQTEALTLSARVRHSTRELDGSWTLGCTFDSAISADLLELMLE